MVNPNESWVITTIRTCVCDYGTLHENKFPTTLIVLETIARAEMFSRITNP